MSAASIARDKAIADLQQRVAVLESKAHTHDPVPPPPDPEPATGIQGPATGGDSKGNIHIGSTKPGREVMYRWRTGGGAFTGFAYVQRFGDPSYSKGDGGRIELSLYRCGASGLPEGTPLAVTTFQPVNPHGAAEDTRTIPWTGNAGDPGLVAVVMRDVHADPVNNWHSANTLWTPSEYVTSPRQPAFPDDSLATFERRPTEGVTAWRLVPQATPPFDMTFADGRHEGQAFFERYVDSQEAIIGTAARERFTSLDKPITKVGFRVLRRTATALDLTLGGKTVRVDISKIPPERSSDGRIYYGHQWVTAQLATTFGSPFEVRPIGGEIRVSPIRPVKGWQSRSFAGTAEKLVGSSWQPFYASDRANLQWYAA